MAVEDRRKDESIAEYVARRLRSAERRSHKSGGKKRKKKANDDDDDDDNDDVDDKPAKGKNKNAAPYAEVNLVVDTGKHASPPSADELKRAKKRARTAEADGFDAGLAAAAAQYAGAGGGEQWTSAMPTGGLGYEGGQYSGFGSSAQGSTNDISVNVAGGSGGSSGGYGAGYGGGDGSAGGYGTPSSGATLALLGLLGVGFGAVTALARGGTTTAAVARDARAGAVDVVAGAIADAAGAAFAAHHGGAGATTGGGGRMTSGPGRLTRGALAGKEIRVLPSDWTDAHRRMYSTEVEKLTRELRHDGVLSLSDVASAHDAATERVHRSIREAEGTVSSPLPSGWTARQRQEYEALVNRRLLARRAHPPALWGTPGYGTPSDAVVREWFASTRAEVEARVRAEMDETTVQRQVRERRAANPARVPRRERSEAEIREMDAADARRADERRVAEEAALRSTRARTATEAAGAAPRFAERRAAHGAAMEVTEEAPLASMDVDPGTSSADQRARSDTDRTKGPAHTVAAAGAAPGGSTPQRVTVLDMVRGVVRKAASRVTGNGTQAPPETPALELTESLLSPPRSGGRMALDSMAVDDPGTYEPPVMDDGRPAATGESSSAGNQVKGNGKGKGKGKDKSKDAPAGQPGYSERIRRAAEMSTDATDLRTSTYAAERARIEAERLRVYEAERAAQEPATSRRDAAATVAAAASATVPVSDTGPQQSPGEQRARPLAAGTVSTAPPVGAPDGRPMQTATDEYEQLREATRARESAALREVALRLTQQFEQQQNNPPSTGEGRASSGAPGNVGDIEMTEVSQDTGKKMPTTSGKAGKAGKRITAAPKPSRMARIARAVRKRLGSAPQSSSTAALAASAPPTAVPLSTAALAASAPPTAVPLTTAAVAQLSGNPERGRTASQGSSNESFKSLNSANSRTGLLPSGTRDGSARSSPQVTSEPHDDSARSSPQVTTEPREVYTPRTQAVFNYAVAEQGWLSAKENVAQNQRTLEELRARLKATSAVMEQTKLETQIRDNVLLQSSVLQALREAESTYNVVAARRTGAHEISATEREALEFTRRQRDEFKDRAAAKEKAHALLMGKITSSSTASLVRAQPPSASNAPVTGSGAASAFVPVESHGAPAAAPSPSLQGLPVHERTAAIASTTSSSSATSDPNGSPLTTAATASFQPAAKATGGKRSYPSPPAFDADRVTSPSQAVAGPAGKKVGTTVRAEQGFQSNIHTMDDLNALGTQTQVARPAAPRQPALRTSAPPRARSGATPPPPPGGSVNHPPPPSGSGVRAPSAGRGPRPFH